MYFIVGSAVSSFDQHFVAARGQFSQGQNYKFMRLLKGYFIFSYSSKVICLFEVKDECLPCHLEGDLG